jgi:beta-lactamase regulating signal transducer with metallopeptidase domain
LLNIGLPNALAATLMAAAVACLRRPLRGVPALQHCLWVLVLLKLLTPPLWTVPIAWLPAPPHAAPQLVAEARVVGVEESELIVESVTLAESAAEPGLLDELPAPQAVELAVIPAEPAADWAAVLPWAPLAVAVWLVGSAAVLLATGWRIRRFQRLLSMAGPASDDVAVMVRELADRLRLKRVPSVWWMPGALSPMIWAVGTPPRLILPQDLWKRLDKPQRATLLAHELAHLKRRDHWLRGLELLATALYWWLPPVWWARRALREAEEQCCDAWVVWAFPHHARKYAEALLDAVESLSPLAPAPAMSAAGLGQVRHLKRRLTMIMQGKTPRSLGWSGGMFAFGLATVLLPMTPTWGQSPEPTRADVVTEVRLADPIRPVNEAVRTEVAIDKLVQMTDGAGQPVSVKFDAVTEQTNDQRVGQPNVEEVVVYSADGEKRVARLAVQQKDPEARKKAIAEALQKLQELLAEDGDSAAVRFRARVEKPGAKAADPKADAERKAALDKLHAELKALKERAHAKQRELQEIHAELQKKHAELATLGAGQRHMVVIETADAVAGNKGADADLGAVLTYHGDHAFPLTQNPNSDAKPATVLMFRDATVTATKRVGADVQAVIRPVKPPTGSADPSRDQRLAGLEKKLEELRSELAKLKTAK